MDQGYQTFNVSSFKEYQDIILNIPDDQFTRVVREDPERRGLLVAGTERGVTEPGADTDLAGYRVYKQATDGSWAATASRSSWRSSLCSCRPTTRGSGLAAIPTRPRRRRSRGS